MDKSALARQIGEDADASSWREPFLAKDVIVADIKAKLDETPEIWA